MKKIFFALTICFIASTVCLAQSQYEKLSLNKLNKLMKEKNDSLEMLKGSIARINQRSFVEETPEDAFKKEVVSYSSVEDMVRDYRKMNNLKRKYGNLNLCQLYSDLIAICLSTMPAPKQHGALGGCYEKEQNDRYKNQIVVIKKEILKFVPEHNEHFRQSLDNLEESLNDYRFAMFELARVINLVNEKAKTLEGPAILSQLKADEETELVDKVSFTRDQLQKYVKSNVEQRITQIAYLNSMCPEAFKDIKL